MMCDTVCAVGPQGVLFGKNSDREPGEAQVVELHPARAGLGGHVGGTPVEVAQVARTRGVLLSRPAWMWGCEMGANDAGVVAGNEAVFTRLPVEATGLSGMDLMRLALERGGSARECLEVVTGLLARFAQGGRMAFRNRSFRYHSSFLFADHTGAWVLETAGPFWAAEQVKGVRTISNALSIRTPDLVHPGAADEARRRGWLKRGAELDFAGCFGAPLFLPLTGAAERRACTATGLGDPTTATVPRVQQVLRDHRGQHPADGLRLITPCGHASWQPTRHAGQTTGSMVSQLEAGGARHWLTGTSSPCLSVFKPVALGMATGELGPPATEQSNDRCLFWRHERLHREVLRGYEGRKAAFEGERVALEARAAAATTAEEMGEAWREHAEVLPRWLEQARAVPARSGGWAFDAWWRKQSRLDGLG